MINHEFRVLMLTRMSQAAGRLERTHYDTAREYERGAIDALDSLLDDYMRLHGEPGGKK